MKKLNTEIFKERVIEKFGNIFDLSEVNYINSKTNVTIKCPIHGEFNVSPNNFLTQSKGCPMCIEEQRGNKRMIPFEEFVKKANEIHKNKFKYVKDAYRGVSFDVEIICPIHGKFKQNGIHHLQGFGCSKCSNNYHKTTEEFIKEFKNKFGNNFIFDKTEYKNNKTNVIITCLEHGDFEATPNFLLSNATYACTKCYQNQRGVSRRKTFEEFLAEARKIHGDKYIYDEGTYVNTHTKMKMKCTVCGCEFEQLPKMHIGVEHNGCPRCARILTGLKCRKPYDKFLEQAREIHGDKYIYHNDYVNAFTPMRITCPTHGDFYQRPFDHICGKRGCPKCNESHLERDVRLYLEKNNIEYIFQKHFNFLGKQTVDFYLPKFNIAIECQGKQHFGLGGWGDKDYVNYQMEVLDVNKNRKLQEHGVKLLYYANETDKNNALTCENKLYTEENTYFSVDFLGKFK